MKNIKFNLRKVYFTAILSVFILTGCEKEYLDQEPQDSLTEAVYFEKPEHFENAANRFYRRLGFEYGDETSDLSGNISANPAYGQGGGVTSTNDPIWSSNYSLLRDPNILIQKAEEFTGEQSEIAEPVGVAYFFRAWHHFKLLQRFGGVPIVLSPLETTSEELYAPRNSRYEVVFQILNDLDVAIEKLPSQNTLGTDDQGKLSLEAAKSFKARVLLYEATWEKYVGAATDGDGNSQGAGSAMPSGYPGVQEMLTQAKQESSDVINSGAFELWDHRAELGDRHLYYLFNLEDAGSNPAGLTKADNKEYIFQTVFDYTLRQIRQNITHAKPLTPSRELMDLYLVEDGLPVQHSPLFEGYETLTSEFQNRDMRLTSFVNTPLKQYWGWGSNVDGGGAQYGVAFENSGIEFDYRYVPQLQSPSGGRNIGYEGVKFTTEHRLRETREESFNYPHIRYAEVLLIYAEATVELNDGAISDADLDMSINKIRERSGVAPLTNALIAPYSDLNMLGEIRRERAIELYGENFRFDDVKRWGIAEEELNNTVSLTYVEGTEYETAENPLNPGNKIYNPDAFPYGVTQSEVTVSPYDGVATTKPGALILDPGGNRNFTLTNYLDPIPTDQIRLNPALLQNPGW